MADVSVTRRVLGFAFLICLAMGEQVFAQSSPFGLLSDSWNMPTYRGYPAWQPYDDFGCCRLPPAALPCESNCGGLSSRSNFGAKPDSILYPEPDDPGGPSLPPGHNKSCPCGPCKTTVPASPSSPSSPAPTSTFKPVEATSRRGALPTVKREIAPAYQVVRRRQTAPITIAQSTAKRFPENDGWVPVTMPIKRVARSGK